MDQSATYTTGWQAAELGNSGADKGGRNEKVLHSDGCGEIKDLVEIGVELRVLGTRCFVGNSRDLDNCEEAKVGRRSKSSDYVGRVESERGSSVAGQVFSCHWRGTNTR